MKLFKKVGKKEEKESTNNSKDAAKERLHLVLMQDRANVSADFLELMKQEIIEVIKKYIDVDESAIDVKLTNQENEDGTNGAPALYANIPIVNIKNEARKVEHKKEEKQKQEDIKEEELEKDKTKKENHKEKSKSTKKQKDKQENKKESTNAEDGEIIKTENNELKEELKEEIKESNEQNEPKEQEQSNEQEKQEIQEQEANQEEKQESENVVNERLAKIINIDKK